MCDWAKANERARKQKDAELVAYVKAVNAAHAYAMKLFPMLTDIFRPWVGKQIETKGGPLLAKVDKLLPTFPSTHALQVFRHVTRYSLAWTVKACEVAEDPDEPRYGTAQYYEVTVYIGDMSNGVLTKLCESYQQPPNWRSDFTVEGVLAAREAAKKAKALYDEAESKCYPFGER